MSDIQNPVCVCGRIEKAKSSEWNLISIMFAIVYPISALFTLVGALTGGLGSNGLFLIFFIALTGFIAYSTMRSLSEGHSLKCSLWRSFFKAAL